MNKDALEQPNTNVMYNQTPVQYTNGLLELAELAGFILTDDKTGIDWSSDYDDCLIKFAMLLGAKNGDNDV